MRCHHPRQAGGKRAASSTFENSAVAECADPSSPGEYRLVRMFAMDESAGVVEVPRRAGCVHNGRHGHKGHKEAAQALA